MFGLIKKIFPTLFTTGEDYERLLERSEATFQREVAEAESYLSDEETQAQEAGASSFFDDSYEKKLSAMAPVDITGCDIVDYSLLSDRWDDD